MIVAVASGKGGTGKTSVTAALASVWPRPLAVVDQDVEAPNLHLSLAPRDLQEEAAFQRVPVLDRTRCTACGLCAARCQFKALALLGRHLMVTPEMCHGCGSCLQACPTGALQPGTRTLGTVITGTLAGGRPYLAGRLRVGEAMSPPLMAQVRRRLRERLAVEARDVLVDGPPGVSCPAMTAVKDADVLVLVTEPTPFGLHDLRLAIQAFRPLGRPMGVVVNRAGLGDDRVQAHCHEIGLPLLAEIPFRRDLAAHLARGGVLAQADEALAGRFRALAARVLALGEGVHA